MSSRLANSVRRRLSYATVVSAISVFLLLAGGAALAAGGLGKNSVGTKQLKKNAVTEAKIKKNAVTAAKVKKSAATGAKFKSGSVGAQSLDLASTGYSRTVAVLKSAGPVTIGEDPTQVPLATGSYTQPAGEDDFYVGSFTGTIPPSCEGAERDIFLGVYLDPATPNEEDRNAQILGNNFHGREPGNFTATMPLGPNEWSFRPPAALGHTLTAFARVSCPSGPNTATIDSVEIKVIGTK
jgi:hypothetical protein